jgi:hypothetical protein
MTCPFFLVCGSRDGDEVDACPWCCPYWAGWGGGYSVQMANQTQNIGSSVWTEQKGKAMCPRRKQWVYGHLTLNRQSCSDGPSFALLCVYVCVY